MKTYKFVADKEEMINSEEFKNDEVTMVVNEMNDSLTFSKCRGVKLEVTDEWKDRYSFVEINGYVLNAHTVAKLITKGIVRVVEVKGESNV